MSGRLKVFLAVCTLGAVGSVSILLMYGFYHVDGPAMEPTLFAGDGMVMSRFRPANLGDVVVVYSPLDGVSIVKRIVAVGGDVVSEVDGELFVNGVSTRGAATSCPPQVEQYERTICRHSRAGDVDYLTLDADRFLRDIEPTHVPEGHIWVRGDHRDQSNDSNNPRIGAIPLGRVQGVLVTTY